MTNPTEPSQAELTRALLTQVRHIKIMLAVALFVLPGAALIVWLIVLLGEAAS